MIKLPRGILMTYLYLNKYKSTPRDNKPQRLTFIPSRLYVSTGYHELKSHS